MHILHIANSFTTTSVYKNLVQAIDDNGIRQTVVVPMKESYKNLANTNKPYFKTHGSIIMYLPVVKEYHRLLLDLKINKVLKTIEDKVNLSEVSCIHAGTAFYDGAIAYEFYKKYGIPYITAVRATDIFAYYPFFRLHWNYFSNILNAANRVIFINTNHHNWVNKNIIKSQKEDSKYLVIPNGIDKYFLSNINKDKRKFDEAAYNNKATFEVFKEADKLKYKLEYLGFYLFPKKMSWVYKTLNMVK